ncbi:Alpha/beta hydrolase family protein [Roseivivax sp. THAF40]|uniref:alpha/beta hydrolase family esterase n=1 Tax=unclassified Roseivivax TaxID=2639302 RepID=UPI0012682A48|nr:MULTISPECIES: prolyl oligopeptidase family serine peptidase [unclassified Roseivivax]QFS83480.1 Alpha/beta hydrolase family protein [Roseivivax sp. THAF197b]QFT47225.1 Alpha/beta hydrolase family protein [Roseivivax sp. THAF40]
MRGLAALLVVFLSALPLTAKAGCGDAPGPCALPGGGTYHIELPTEPRADGAALMFLHGWGSSGQGTLSMRGVVETALGRGYAVIAPDGIPREGRNGRTWAFNPERAAPRDEVAFLQSVRDAAADRFGLSPDAMLLSGFSIGGSMASYLACAAPDTFAAYAPVAGSFWRPHPASCEGPVRLLHTHGWRDQVVPLEGRLLRGAAPDAPGAVAQGDVWYAMDVWRRANGCPLMADRFATDATYMRRTWDGCGPGAALEFALFDGGHAVPEGWAAMALDWFEGLDLATDADAVE